MSEQKSKYFTLMIMPETSGAEVRRMRVARRWVVTAVATLGAVLLTAGGAVAYGVWQHGETVQNRALAAENVALREQLEDFEAKLHEVDGVVERMRHFDKKLRALTMVSDPERNLAIGPVGDPMSTAPERADTVRAETLRGELLGSSARSAALVAQHLDALAHGAESTQDAIAELSTFLTGQQAVLSATPSRRPAHGYVTSGYGMRVDPFTGLPQFHAGLDFSARLGAKVMSTADGVVTFRGKKGAYGKVIEVEHDSGFVTKYAHLSEIRVELGQRVRRGQTIGAVGNTGRSTGPHLHYEVRLRGVTQNPQRFLLE